MKKLFLVLLVALTVSADLPRRGMAGLMVGAEDGRVIVRNLVPGRPAEKAGFQVGDVIRKLDGVDVTSTEDFTSRLGKHKGGETALIEYTRGELARTAELKLAEWPRETGEAYDATYGSVTADGNRYRTILTTPKEKTPTATLFIVQGVGCGSIDNPPGDSAYRTLIESLSRRGFATLRVDKPGMGDSEGGPCATAGFHTEVNAYRAALASIQDRKNVFLFGHSMGGIMAPLIAQAAPLKGIAVYGMASSTWLQYSLENRRRQMRLLGEPFEAIDEEDRVNEKFMSLFYVQKQPLEKIVAEHAEFAEAFGDGKTYAAGKSGKYFQELYDVPLMKAWKATSAPLLAIWGASDFLTDGTEHEWVAAAVNSWRPGTAKYVRLEGMDHWLYKAADQKASMTRQGDGEYDDRIAETLAAFMAENANPPTPRRAAVP